MTTDTPQFSFPLVITFTYVSLREPTRVTCSPHETSLVSSHSATSSAVFSSEWDAWHTASSCHQNSPVLTQWSQCSTSSEHRPKAI